MRTLLLSLAGLVLAAQLVLAQPGVEIEYRAGVAWVRLEGDYSNSRYTAYRGDQASGPFQPLTESGVLCLGECLVGDPAVTPGRTYWYRFDLVLADGRSVTFGPYPVTIGAAAAGRISLSIAPHPVRGPARLAVSIEGAPGGAATPVRVALYDLQGRELGVIHDAPLRGGTTSIAWDGHLAGRGDLAPGLYMVRVDTPHARIARRLVRVR